ncbi:hypothetical protein CYMTET_25342 [Cymbomonas tetramitiformis]|uniref:Uncharacterized protein n=1 Tax=Cymbomonas tetramitiformis TaxID=36881 RepID=A0AAE0KZ03_9CHLO|nr:hypothetical protein CYMTET_25342 [Cymbomonas tetramitiformis]
MARASKPPETLGEGSVTETLDDQTWEHLESVYLECTRTLSSMYTTTQFVHEKFCKVSGLMKKSSYESIPGFGTSALPESRKPVVTLPELRRLDENTATHSFPPPCLESVSDQHWLNLSPEAEAQLIAILEEQVETCESLKRSCDKYAAQLQQDLRLNGDVLKSLAVRCRKEKSRILPLSEKRQHSDDVPNAAIPTTSAIPTPEEATAPPSANDGEDCSRQESETAETRVDQGHGTHPQAKEAGCMQGYRGQGCCLQAGRVIVHVREVGCMLGYGGRLATCKGMDVAMKAGSRQAQLNAGAARAWEARCTQARAWEARCTQARVWEAGAGEERMAARAKGKARSVGEGEELEARAKGNA